MYSETIVETGEEAEKAMINTSNYYLKKKLQNEEEFKLVQEDENRIIGTIPVEKVQFRGNRFSRSVFIK